MSITARRPEELITALNKLMEAADDVETRLNQRVEHDVRIHDVLDEGIELSEQCSSIYHTAEAVLKEINR